MKSCLDTTVYKRIIRFVLIINLILFRSDNLYIISISVMETEVRGADRREKWRSKRLISMINEIQLKTVIIKNKKSKTIFSFFKGSKTIFILKRRRSK